MTSPRGWIVVILVLLVAALPIAWTHQSRVRLQSDTAVARERLRQLGALETENGRLQRQLDGGGADSAEETAQARATLVQLHGEIDQEGRALAAAAGIAAAPFSAGSVVPASEWQNAGTATAEAALETALWAAAGGDVDALARLLHLSADSRAAVEKVLAGLPAETRAKYASAEA